jgi:hypothetical protein
VTLGRNLVNSGEDLLIKFILSEAFILKERATTIPEGSSLKRGETPEDS